MPFRICARCHTVLFPNMQSDTLDIVYCPNCDDDLSPRDFELFDFAAFPLFVVTLVPEYAKELNISHIIADDFQTSNLIGLGVATERTLVTSEAMLEQRMSQLIQQRQHSYCPKQADRFNLINVIRERRNTIMLKNRNNARLCPPEPQKKPNTSIPIFFIIRMVAWFALAALVAIATVTFGFILKKWDASCVLGLMLAALLLYKGLELLYIARKNKYFVLELECIEITERNLKDVRNIWDPTSQTAFRKTATVSFTDAGGLRLQFIFDACRHFVIGRTYNFYFRRPQNDSACITVEMLEQLKIDHEVHSSQISDIAVAKPIRTSFDTQDQQA